MAVEDDWNTKARWMRSVGASAAQWDVSGACISLELGAEPLPFTPEETKPRTSTEVERKLGHVGGIVRRGNTG